MTLHFFPAFFCFSSLQPLMPDGIVLVTSDHPALLAASDRFPLCFEFSSFRIALHPLFLASLIFFAALLSALLGCLFTPTVIGLGIQGVGLADSLAELTLWIVSRRCIGGRRWESWGPCRIVGLLRLRRFTGGTGLGIFWRELGRYVVLGRAITGP
jgi:hypothetical protein